MTNVFRLVLANDRYAEEDVAGEDRPLRYDLVATSAVQTRILRRLIGPPVLRGCEPYFNVTAPACG